MIQYKFISPDSGHIGISRMSSMISPIRFMIILDNTYPRRPHPEAARICYV